MPNRIATSASALVASILASLPLATISHGATPAADECLAGPKGQAPAGSHWYYRIEQSSKRHCWYVRAQQEARGQTATPDASTSTTLTSTTSVPPNAAATMPGSVANARAELSSSQARDDQGSSAANGQLPARAASAGNGSQASLSNTGPQTSVVSSRWPDQLAANSTTAVASASDDSRDSTSTAAAPSTVAAPFAAADAASDKKSSSIQMLIIAIVGALSAAGLAVSAVGLNSKRKSRIREIDGGTENGRRAIWESFAERPLASPFPAAPALRPQIGIPTELREADDPDDRVADMLARLARSAQV